MGFYFRKSKNISKNTRLHFSKSGAGVSTGIKGVRIGVNSKGQIYTHVGRNGVYYKKNIIHILTILKIIKRFLNNFLK